MEEMGAEPLFGPDKGCPGGIRAVLAGHSGNDIPPSPGAGRQAPRCTLPLRE